VEIVKNMLEETCQQSRASGKWLAGSFDYRSAGKQSTDVRIPAALLCPQSASPFFAFRP